MPVTSALNTATGAGLTAPPAALPPLDTCDGVGKPQFPSLPSWTQMLRVSERTEPGAVA
jgi:hypothetical protein